MSSPSRPPSSSPPLDEGASDLERVQVKLVEALHELQKGGVAPAANAAEAIRCVQKALTLLGDSDDSSELGPIDWPAFATRLRERREAAELSQEALAELVGVSSTTIRNLERQRKRPGRGLMLKLLAVPQLNLRVSDIELDSVLSPGVTWTPTSWFAPRYDPVAMVSDMVEVLNGEGGQVEQTLLYFDPQSASDWMATCNSTAYIATYRTGQPFEPVAKHIAEHLGDRHLIVNALGCGDGKTEVSFVNQILPHLAEGTRPELYLLDVSHALLNAAHKHATEELPDLRVLTVHGNFHELPRYTMMTQPWARRRRLYTMLGLTLVNLRDEVRFFRDTLSGCAPGDWFLCDILIAHAAPERPEEIRSTDPALLNKVRPSHAAWLAGPLRRYCRGIADVEFHLELDTRCPVPGSYGLDFMATVKMQGGLPDRRFLMWKTRRYDPQKLAESLAGVGWQPELTIPYGQGASSKPTLALMLFRKK